MSRSILLPCDTVTYCVQCIHNVPLSLYVCVDGSSLDGGSYGSFCSFCPLCWSCRGIEREREKKKDTVSVVRMCFCFDCLLDSVCVSPMFVPSLELTRTPLT